MQEQCRLYHYPICPFSRKIRILMNEKEVKYTSFVENFWEGREKFQLMNPTGNVPFLAIKRENERSLLIFGNNSITSFLEERYSNRKFVFGNIDTKTEINKMTEWFDNKFYNDVSKYIINERVYSWYKNQREADVQLLKIARLNLENHLEFIENILNKRDFIACDDFSLADISCAAQISSLDYLGEINWQICQATKEWYSIIKSKPSFRDLLTDSLSGFKPSSYYRELDF